MNNDTINQAPIGRGLMPMDMLEAAAKAQSNAKPKPTHTPAASKADEATAKVSMLASNVKGSVECLDRAIVLQAKLISDLGQIGDTSQKVLNELGAIRELMRDARGPLTTATPV